PDQTPESGRPGETAYGAGWPWLPKQPSSAQRPHDVPVWPPANGETQPPSARYANRSAISTATPPLPPAPGAATAGHFRYRLECSPFTYASMDKQARAMCFSTALTLIPTLLAIWL